MLASAGEAFDGLSNVVTFSSKIIAASRAVESESPTPLFRDPLAAHFAGDLALSEARAIPRSSARIPIRTRFFDDFASHGLSTGANQLVILGAGMDARAWRLDAVSNRTVVFELDLREVLDEKHRVVRELEQNDAKDVPRLRGRRVAVPVDLSDPARSWRKALVNAGFDTGEQSVWLIEGLLYYFEAEEVSLLMLGIRTMIAPGSTLCASVVGEKSDAVRKSPSSRGWNLADNFKWRCPDPRVFFEGVGFAVDEVVRIGEPAADYGRWTRTTPGNTMYVRMTSAAGRPTGANGAYGREGSCKSAVDRDAIAKRTPKVWSEVTVAPEYCDLDSDFDGVMFRRSVVDEEVPATETQRPPSLGQGHSKAEDVSTAMEQMNVADKQANQAKELTSRSDDVLSRSPFPRIARLQLEGFPCDASEVYVIGDSFLGDWSWEKAVAVSKVEGSRTIWDVLVPRHHTKFCYQYLVQRLGETGFVEAGDPRELAFEGTETVKVQEDRWRRGDD